MDTHTSLNNRPQTDRPVAGIPGLRGKWLVVDDDALVRSVIASVLEDHLKAAVIECDSGDLAWEAWKRFPGIEGIVTDFDMPGMSGLELAARIRSEDPKTPIILVTGRPEALDPDWSGKKDVDRILTKPFSCDGLASAIHTTQQVTNWLVAA